LCRGGNDADVVEVVRKILWHKITPALLMQVTAPVLAIQGLSVVWGCGQRVMQAWCGYRPALGAIVRRERNTMKVTTSAVKSAIAAGGIAAAGVLAAATASAAPPNIQGFGTSEQLVDGPLITNYTVSNLQPSNSAIPGYTPKGTLYQADITARSDGGLVTPMVNDFIARGPNGQNYRVIDKVQAPGSLNPAPIPQGSESTGTLYFDVTGAPPNGVVYNDGMQDILIWTSNMPGASAPGAPNASPAPGTLPGPAPHT
jgi:Domain of unknown function (DUF1942)